MLSVNDKAVQEIDGETIVPMSDTEVNPDTTLDALRPNIASYPGY